MVTIANICLAAFQEEQASLQALLDTFSLSESGESRIKKRATTLIERIRESHAGSSLFQAFLQQYHLGSREGVLLMCLAESLIRIPDKETANALIRDKLSDANWDKHLGQSEHWLINASSWGLMLTGKWMSFKRESEMAMTDIVKRLTFKTSEPILRTAIEKAMGLMGQNFVVGTSIENAISRTLNTGQPEYYSYDMLGEAALTQADVERYYQAYWQAVDRIGHLPSQQKAFAAVSIKLSALHPRYETLKAPEVLEALVERLKPIILHAAAQDVPVNIDAEECERVSLGLEIFEKLFQLPELSDWQGLGMVVQAYQKSALLQCQYLTQLSAASKKRIPVRLVKGAYWDSEIKRAQQLGLEAYPVFTTKAATDLSYLCCAQYLMSQQARFTLQFATHNAHTVASIIEYAEEYQVKEFEFQRLFGMGDGLYDAVKDMVNAPCRVYAPVGDHKALLPYLIRRLLENGANSSFVHQLTDTSYPIEKLVVEPRDIVMTQDEKNVIPLPNDLYGETRKNSSGLDIHCPPVLKKTLESLHALQTKTWGAQPLLAEESINTADTKSIENPANPEDRIGEAAQINSAGVETAIREAYQQFPTWRDTEVSKRAQMLLTVADLFEEKREELLSLCIREAGKTLQDAIDEIREAVDFCRYYATQAKKSFTNPQVLPGPTGEANQLHYQGRGVFVCISPWNFPLAIFTGQIAAALAAGNVVLAKPAAQTSAIAYFAVNCFYQAGCPRAALQLLVGPGAQVGNQLTSDKRIAGVAFTGSNQTARQIQTNLVEKSGAMVPFIAETGGQNAMIADTSALPEQLVKDVIASAFKSAGQRCSALRVLYLQREMLDEVWSLIVGAMNELVVSDPVDIRTDVGPVIDANAKAALEAHIDKMKSEAKRYHQAEVLTNTGHFVRPSLFQIDGIHQLTEEVFGPILHLVPYESSDIEDVIEAINHTGYGLTLGIHSRIESFAQNIASKVNVGNVYINRNMVGAVVGVQPFGGMGLSGTGPKAGGPGYLHAFTTEKTISTNTAAIGGNLELLVGSDIPEV